MLKEYNFERQSLCSPMILPASKPWQNAVGNYIGGSLRKIMGPFRISPNLNKIHCIRDHANPIKLWIYICMQIEMIMYPRRGKSLARLVEKLIIKQ